MGNMSTAQVPDNTAPLRRARLKAGLTQAALAKRIKVCRPSVTRWEGGRSKPEPVYIPRLAKALKLSEGEVVDALFTK